MRFTFAVGAITDLKPRDLASLIRVSNLLTDLTSPPKPTSPIKMTDLGKSLSLALDATAVMTAKSAAGSSILSPPTKLTKTSLVHIKIPSLFSRTANNIANRLKSNPFTLR
mgnify:CR=1 FL=1